MDNNRITEFVDQYGKIGDTVYGIVSYCIDCIERDDGCHRGCKNPKYRLIKSVVHHFIVSEKEIEICDFSEEIRGTLNEDVFLNIDEAQKALEQLNNN